MSLRFLLGACVSTVINLGIALIFWASHAEMVDSVTYRYVLFHPWLWVMWTLWFGATAACQLAGVARNNPDVVRWGTSFGIVAKALWTVMFFIVLFDPAVTSSTGMAQWLTSGILSLELVFLALPNTPRLDAVVKRASNKERRVPQVP